ncbi:putative curli production assembly/transport component CsgG [uncultured Desulfatiglans sp.]|uniref:Putative curli production assembly/transport component CsgG n=1 Tax=Uncultured Desulfatiglans sp. TaxID=1748965 RepID=A0A653AG09_UNCDX|nr:putative curli production assembly/transport component CsgG [uncultured Desulfatiglans sp.]
MRKENPLLIIASFALLAAGCATLDEDTVVQMPQQPVISKTLQQSQEETPKGLKRKVAVARFSNETRYGQSFFIDASNDRIGKQALDILSAKLMATDKFILLERADLDKIEKELALGNAGNLRNMADYLIVGSVTAFGRKDQSEVGIFSRVKKQIAYAKVHIRLIDVYTGQIIYSEEGEGEAFSEAGTVFGVGQKAGYDSALNDKALETAINNLSSNIIENLLDKPWKAYILGYEDGYFIISGGQSQNIKPGSFFEVIQEGKKVKNPQTNMFLTLPGHKIAELEVVQCVGDTVENEVSLCNLAHGSLSPFIEKNDFSQLYISESDR